MDDAQHICNAYRRSFAGPGPLNYHMRSCRSGKRQLEGALQLWQDRSARKRRKLNLRSNLQSDSAHPTPATSQSDTDAFESMRDSAPTVSVSVSCVVIIVQAESNQMHREGT